MGDDEELDADKLAERARAWLAMHSRPLLYREVVDGAVLHGRHSIAERFPRKPRMRKSINPELQRYIVLERVTNARRKATDRTLSRKIYKERLRKLAFVFEDFGINPDRADAFELLALRLCVEHLPGFAARSVGRPEISAESRSTLWRAYCKAYARIARQRSQSTPIRTLKRKPRRVMDEEPQPRFYKGRFPDTQVLKIVTQRSYLSGEWVHGITLSTLQRELKKAREERWARLRWVVEGIKYEKALAEYSSMPHAPSDEDDEVGACISDVWPWSLAPGAAPPWSYENGCSPKDWGGTGRRWHDKYGRALTKPRD